MKALSRATLGRLSCLGLRSWQPPGRQISGVVGLAGALVLTKPTKCEETEGTKMFRMAVERYMPGMIQEIETGRLVLEQVNEAGMIVLKVPAITVVLMELQDFFFGGLPFHP